MIADFQRLIMNIWDRTCPLRADQCSKDDTAGQANAVCTAWAWLVLYGMAVAGSFFGAGQHKHERPVIAAEPVNLEYSK
jgi:hypothetical protein